MSDPRPTNQTATKPTSGQDWVPHLAAFLHRSSPARAVSWDHTETELSVATVGSVNEAELRRCLEETIAAAQVKPTHPTAELKHIDVHHQPGKTTLTKKGHDQVTANVWTWRRVPWPTPQAAAGLHEDDDTEWHELALLAAACGGLGLAGLITGWLNLGPAWLPTALYVLSMIAGGWDAAKDALPNLFRGKLDIHFLMIAVALGASFIGAYGEGALLLFLFSLAGAMEHFALYRTRREIHALFRVAPKTAMRRDEQTGEEHVVPVDEVVEGDRLVIRPGDIFPVDAVVLTGETAADESTLTGEAIPVPKGIGDEVYSGTMNQWGAVDVACNRPAGESALQKVIRLIQTAREMRAPSQRLTDRFGPKYTAGLLLVTTAMFFLWWLGLGMEPFLNVTVDGTTTFSAFYRAMTLLVVASPCALVLSIPSAILAAIAWGARHGILFRGGAAIEELAGIHAVALDKTGTLTTGDLKVESVESFPPGRERDVAELAFTLEQQANHPIARAIVRYGKAHGLTARTAAAFRSVTGQGVEATIDEQTCMIGRRALLEKGPLAEWARELPEPPVGLSEVWFVHGELLGRILLEDQVREESAEVLTLLHDAGLRVLMLTGDRKDAAMAVAEKMNLAEVRAGLTPEGKVQAIQELRNQGYRMAMVGDGINDAPSLAAADIAVAMGARGSDAALEQSDVVLMNDRIENFYAAFLLSRRARRIIRQNVTLSLGTIVLMVGAAVFGVVPISLGVLAHEGSTVLVCLNSMRLLR